jgi:tRNA(Ile)-lysidine synthase
MLKKVENYIQKLQLLNLNDKVIVGVSGGADSIALLHILHTLGYHCIVAHCNFKLRMDESDTDEEFVRTNALSLKIPYYSINFETIEYAKAHKISTEMAARDLRYNWFTKLMTDNQAQAIAVAHHADDSIETLLMNLVRGTGLKGMTGISARNGNVVRPLLCSTRIEIENYLMKYNLEYRTDSSNATLDYTRNKFRNQVLPLLREINPSVQQTLYNTTKRFEDINAVYNNAIESIKNDIIVKTESGIIINIQKLKKHDHIDSILFEILYSYGFHPDTIQKISTIIEGETGKVFYSEKYRLLKNRDQLIVSKIVNLDKKQFQISESDNIIFEPFTLEIKRLENTSDFILSKNPYIIHVDAEKVSFPLTIRKWTIGDSFFPYGMKNRKKLSDFFIDNKLSLIDKENVWLLLTGNEILWIVGYRSDNRFRISDKTEQILEISVSNI